LVPSAPAGSKLTTKPLGGKSTESMADRGIPDIGIARDRRRGRGTLSNQSGRYEPIARIAFDDGWQSLEELPPFQTTVTIDSTRVTMIVSRVSLRSDNWASHLRYLPSRACSAMVPTSTGPVQLIGLYVPSRDGSPEKTARKRDFLASCRDGLNRMPSRTILMGDLNILEPDHQPHYPFFAPFEYSFYRCLLEEFGMVDAFRHLNPTLVEHSWVGRTGDGYRYDHIFCSRPLTEALTACDYVAEPRLSRLSDHSAMTVGLSLETAVDRRISDASSSLQPLSLF